jgi:hypothetical protein
VYVIEDLHTSYWSRFGGKKVRGLHSVGLLKRLIDDIHAYAQNSSRVSFRKRVLNRAFPNAKSQPPIKSIHIAPGIVFIYKGSVEPGKKLTL